MRKVFLFRKAIEPEKRTWIEKVEHWFMMRGIVLSNKQYFKWYNTTMQERMGEMSLDTKKIILTKQMEQLLGEKRSCRCSKEEDLR